MDREKIDDIFDSMIENIKYIKWEMYLKKHWLIFNVF